MKKNKIVLQYCQICGEEHEINLFHEEKEILFKNTPIRYTHVCSICPYINNNNKYETNEQKNQNSISISNQYRITHNLLTSNDIKNIRKMYDLSKKELSLLLGWHRDQIEQYEKNTLQSIEHNQILLNIKDSPSFIYHRLTRKKDIFSNEKRIKLELLLMKLIKEKQDYFED